MNQPRTSSTHSYSRAIESTDDAFRSAGSTSHVYVSISRCDVLHALDAAPQVVLRRLQRAVALDEDRHVEVHAPLLAAAVLGQRLRQVGPRAQRRRARSPGAGRSGRRTRRSSLVRRRRARVERRRQLGLADADPGGVERVERLPRAPRRRPPSGRRRSRRSRARGRARPATSAIRSSTVGERAVGLGLDRQRDPRARAARRRRATTLRRAAPARPSSSIHGPYDSGLVEIVPSTPSGSSAPRISASRSVYATRSSERQSGACTSAFTGCPWNVPCGKPLIVNTYRPSASSHAAEARAAGRPPAARRSPRPTAAARCRTARPATAAPSAPARARAATRSTASQPTAGWMFVQYVRWRPSPTSITPPRRPRGPAAGTSATGRGTRSGSRRRPGGSASPGARAGASPG